MDGHKSLNAQPRSSLWFNIFGTYDLNIFLLTHYRYLPRRSLRKGLSRDMPIAKRSAGRLLAPYQSLTKIL